jgi:hypothetical protein
MIIMGTLYTRSGEEPAKECAVCKTVWKESYNDQEENMCPFCGFEFIETAKIRLSKAVTRHDARIQKAKELELAQHSRYLKQLEADMKDAPQGDLFDEWGEKLGTNE